MNALMVAESLAGEFEVAYLAAGTKWELLAEQAKKHGSEAVAIADASAVPKLKEALGESVEVLGGRDGVALLAGRDDIDILLNGIVGSAGLEPTVRAAEAGVIIALSNKESLVMGGRLINSIAAASGSEIRPVDSEHSAIWQCLTGENKSEVSRLILTASGGPFRTKPADEFESIKTSEALKHPSWKMGRKITIDSATLMNKGLEVIEAYFLFDIPPERIDIVIHPQSIIHSMVEFVDGSVKAQLGLPDMKLPIQYALTAPRRADVAWEETNLAKVGSLTFEAPDYERFPCLGLAFDALKAGGTAPAILNVANEAAVNLFLGERIGFMDIARIVEEMISSEAVDSEADLAEILEMEKTITAKVLEKWG